MNPAPAPDGQIKHGTDIRELHVSVANALGAPLSGAQYPGLRG